MNNKDNTDVKKDANDVYYLNNKNDIDNKENINNKVNKDNIENINNQDNENNKDINNIDNKEKTENRNNENKRDNIDNIGNKNNSDYKNNKDKFNNKENINIKENKDNINNIYNKDNTNNKVDINNKNNNDNKDNKDNIDSQENTDDQENRDNKVDINNKNNIDNKDSKDNFDDQENTDNKENADNEDNTESKADLDYKNNINNKYNKDSEQNINKREKINNKNWINFQEVQIFTNAVIIEKEINSNEIINNQNKLNNENREKNLNNSSIKKLINNNKKRSYLSKSLVKVKITNEMIDSCANKKLRNNSYQPKSSINIKKITDYIKIIDSNFLVEKKTITKLFESLFNNNNDKIFPIIKQFLKMGDFLNLTSSNKFLNKFRIIYLMDQKQDIATILDLKEKDQKIISLKEKYPNQNLYEKDDKFELSFETMKKIKTLNNEEYKKLFDLKNFENIDNEPYFKEIIIIYRLLIFILNDNNNLNDIKDDKKFLIKFYDYICKKCQIINIGDLIIEKINNFKCNSKIILKMEKIIQKNRNGIETNNYNIVCENIAIFVDLMREVLKYVGIIIDDKKTKVSHVIDAIEYEKKLNEDLKKFIFYESNNINN